MPDPACRTLFLCRLDPTVTTQEIRDAASAFGEIRKVSVLPAKQIGFVEYWDIRDAEGAQARFRSVSIRNRPVDAYFARSKDVGRDNLLAAIYVRVCTRDGLPAKLSNDDVAQLLSCAGDVLNVQMKQDHEWQVEFCDSRSSERAYKMFHDREVTGFWFTLTAKSGEIAPPTTTTRELISGPYLRKNRRPSGSNGGVAHSGGRPGWRTRNASDMRPVGPQPQQHQSPPIQTPFQASDYKNPWAQAIVSAAILQEKITKEPPAPVHHHFGPLSFTPPYWLLALEKVNAQASSSTTGGSSGADNRSDSSLSSEVESDHLLDLPASGTVPHPEDIPISFESGATM